MTTLEEKMELIQELDPSAHIDYSPYTRKWYVSAKIQVGDGTFLTSITEHRDTPQLAVEAYLNELTHVEWGKFLVTEYPERKEWKFADGKFQLSDVAQNIRKLNAWSALDRATQAFSQATTALKEAQQKYSESMIIKEIDERGN